MILAVQAALAPGLSGLMQAGQGCAMHYLGAGRLHLLRALWMAADEAPILNSGVIRFDQRYA